MARGPKKHLKRLCAPKSWMLNKMGGTHAPRPSTGPHKLRESLPLIIGIRNRLKYALTRREVIMIVNRRLVEVDGKIRTDMNYPSGLMDTIHFAKTDEHFRVMYDVKGRFVLHRIQGEEAQYKLCRVQKLSKAKKGTIGHNAFQPGQAGVIPFVVTHDGRTIRYPDPKIQVHDTVKFDIKSGKIVGFLKFDVGNLALITRGANVGRVGAIVSREKHPGSFDIVHLKDRNGHVFATRLANVFVIGEPNKPWISLPKAKGIKMSIMEERTAKLAAKAKDAKKAAKKE
jgi:small subunit ribosomal protein S4e